MSLKRQYSPVNLFESQEVTMPYGQQRKYAKAGGGRVMVKSVRPKRKRSGLKPSKGSTQTFVLSRSLRSTYMLPDRMATTLSTTMDCYWPVGAMTAAAGNYFNIYTNSNVPFGTNYAINASVGGGFTFSSAASLVQGFATSNKPLGWSNFALWYTNYRVRKYRLEVTCEPQNTADTLRLVGFPLGQEEIPSSTAGSVNVRVMESQPFAKGMTCAAATDANTKGNTLVFYGDCASDLGKTETQYADADDTSVGAGPSPIDAFGIFLQQLNGSNNVAVVTCQIKLTQYVTFYDLIQPLN